jgi:hypothetical protein
MERLVVQKKVMREICKQRRKQERSGGEKPGKMEICRFKRTEIIGFERKKIRGRFNQAGDLSVEKQAGDL